MKSTLKRSNIILGLVVLVIIALLLAWYVKRPATVPNVADTSPAGDNNTPLPQEDENNQPAAQPLNRLIVSDQRAGSNIDIDYLNLQQPGFVVIHAAANGQPGKIVASSKLVSAGAKQDLIIPYATTAGTTYFAMLHNDDGDGKFDATKDLPVLDAQGGPVMTMFMAVR